MEAELVALATTGATTLVTVMASDAWVQIKDRFAGFFARRGDDHAAEEMRASQRELTAAAQDGGEDTAADIEAGWRIRLRRALAEDPAAADELRELLAELAPSPDGEREGGVHNNTIKGGVVRTVVQARDISGLTIGDTRGS
ncbi:hypothetical protein ACIQNU_27285 [Streptomyces sp. NPDC091292]|uniref:hypothetical protein n=1 Tax=Streptomyces sp. NPDC091292 TaxID=3365991 RepID=UPI003801148C